MKKILVFLALGFLLGACSDKLTSSKAEDLVKESLEENPMYGKVTIYTGSLEDNNFSKKEGELYNKLFADEYIKIITDKKPVLDWRGEPKEGEFENLYTISLTDKSKDFLLESEHYSGDIYKNTMKSYTAKMDKFSDFHIVSEKEAKANITFLKEEKTPFFPFEKDQTDFFSKEITFLKTEKEGWKIYRE